MKSANWSCEDVWKESFLFPEIVKEDTCESSSGFVLSPPVAKVDYIVCGGGGG